MKAYKYLLCAEMWTWRTTMCFINKYYIITYKKKGGQQCVSYVNVLCISSSTVF